MVHVLSYVLNIYSDINSGLLPEVWHFKDKKNRLNYKKITIIKLYYTRLTKVHSKKKVKY